ncbi:homologous-pairing protein 2 homolog [Homarus americanus]|uniref:Homologous-pairing protein 2-like n=1 Tax=Homarus americanus TaxID=6706 RepID=A0A8J5N246_HOMAM|nr:homologous-pairing protein 2 homolog [Homarus americanus]KAG7171758.1 homologous-pairing protein 2-like [Homarus americanus]
MSKKEAEATEKIKSYLEQQNRPYSVNDIFMNLHKEVGKTAVQKCLDKLVANGSVKEKTYGKQKVYVIDQEQFPALDEQKLKKMDMQLVELNQTIKESEKECVEVEAKLRNLNSSLTTEEASKRVTQLDEEVSKLQQRLSDLQENQVMVSKEEKDKISKANEEMVKQWRKRRRMARDMLDAILEGYPHPKKHLFEEIGIETDEDVGVNLPKT